MSDMRWHREHLILLRAESGQAKQVWCRGCSNQIGSARDGEVFIGMLIACKHCGVVPTSLMSIQAAINYHEQMLDALARSARAPGTVDYD